MLRIAQLTQQYLFVLITQLIILPLSLSAARQRLRHRREDLGDYPIITLNNIGLLYSRIT